MLSDKSGCGWHHDRCGLVVDNRVVNGVVPSDCANTRGTIAYDGTVLGLT